jgi:predicted AlkP superfamily pyrophosphatase or phosphodiesterase
MRRFVVVGVLLLWACGGGSGAGGSGGHGGEGGAGGSGGAGPSKAKHVLIFGIDGLRVDALQAAATPGIDALIADGAVTYDAFAGGELGEVTQQPTFSGPGWSSILTGVWIDKHGVMFNVFDDANFDEYPHFFARVREVNPDVYLSSFVTWAPINESILPSGGGDAAFSPDVVDSAEGDLAVTAAVVAHLGLESPDVLFVALDEVDHQGHVSGYSTTVPEYMGAIETVDSQLGEVLDAVRARDTYDTEDWLVVVTTDHGGIGVGHAGQSDEERTISIIVSGESVADGQTISPGPGHTAVPPTAMKHLGFEVDPSWGWESEAFGL